MHLVLPHALKGGEKSSESGFVFSMEYNDALSLAYE